MKYPREPVRFLSPEEMARLHRNALRILDEVGMRVDHDEALDRLAAAGCRVDRDTRHVSFPCDIVQAGVDRMREQLRTRRHPERMSVRYSHVRFREEPFRVHDDFTVNAGGYNVFICDLTGKRRQATLQDTRDALKLVAQLDQISATGLPVAAQDVPLALRPVVMTAELVKHTSKLGGIEALNLFDVEYICRIGEVVRGGRKDLLKDPILVGYAEAKTPLTLDQNMCEIMLEYLKRGLPQSLDTMPNAGATSPMHPAGTLAVGLAETLAGMVLAYAVDENACISLDITPGFCDMSTGIFKYAGPERHSLLGARIQMIGEYYGCPSGVHGGKTDACAMGERTGVEKAASMLMPVLCGAVGFGTVGNVDANTFSPVQLVIDNEIARYVRGAVRGFEVDDGTINVDLIKRVGIGGNYIQEMDTVERFRDVLELSPFMVSYPWGAEPEAPEFRKWESMAVYRVQELLRNDVETPLSDDQVRAVDEIVEEAAARLLEQGRLGEKWRCEE